MAEDTNTPAADAPKEPTVAELKKQVARFTKDLETVTGQRDDLQKKNADLADELAQAEGIIAEQAEKLTVAEAQAEGGRTVVTHEKKQYRVIGRQLNVDGIVHSAESLTKNPEVVAKLVKSESGFLQLVTK